MKVYGAGQERTRAPPRICFLVCAVLGGMSSGPTHLRRLTQEQLRKVRFRYLALLQPQSRLVKTVKNLIG